MGWFIISVFLLLFGLIGAAIYYEVKNPCIKYSPEISCNWTFITVPGPNNTFTMIPQQHCSHRCLERAN